LFEGGNQASRFSKKLNRVLTIQNFLDSSGLKVEDIGTHSFRKGSATYCTSGSVNGPSIISVARRCDWVLGSVQSKYLKYESAGDQFVGRTVSGLPLQSINFACLPPEFKEPFELDHLFPQLLSFTNLKPLLRYSVASIVYHKGFWEKTLPENHKFFQHPLFSSNILCQTTRNCYLPTISDSNISKATGIPNHVSLLLELSSNREAIDSIPSRIENIIEERNIAMGNITPDYLEKVMMNCFEKNLTKTRGPENDVNHDESRTNSKGSKFYMWQGRFHILPEDFEFPDVNIIQGRKLWIYGNEVKHWPPFRKVTRSDLSSTKSKKLLEDWRTVMKFMEHYVEENQEEIAIQEAIDHLNSFCISSRRKRGAAYLRISSAAKKIRKLNKSREV
jgi:hypothetical protein